MTRWNYLINAHLMQMKNTRFRWEYLPCLLANICFVHALIAPCLAAQTPFFFQPLLLYSWVWRKYPVLRDIEKHVTTSLFFRCKLWCIVISTMLSHDTVSFNYSVSGLTQGSPSLLWTAKWSGGKKKRRGVYVAEVRGLKAHLYEQSVWLH